MDKRFRFRFDRSQSITQSQVDTESTFGPGKLLRFCFCLYNFSLS